MSEWRSGAAMADDLGQLIAVLDLLHRRLGESSLRSEHPPVVCTLDELSLQHAWQATELTTHLPKRDGVDRTALITLGSMAPADPLLDALSHEPERMLVAYRQDVFPSVLASCDVLRASCSEAADRSLDRSLRLVLADLALTAERLEGVRWEAEPLAAAARAQVDAALGAAFDQAGFIVHSQSAGQRG